MANDGPISVGRTKTGGRGGVEGGGGPGFEWLRPAKEELVSAIETVKE